MNKYVSVFVLSVIGFLFMPFALAKKNSQCVAPQSYISQLNSSVFLNKANQDFSCLVDYASILPQIRQYQLVDIRQSPETPVANAWVIPIVELKHKDFLQERHLLLLGDGFSRVSAAQQCSLLKKKGFQNTKVLIGGAELWNSVSAGKKNIPYKNTISAKELLREYFNGAVHIIVPSITITHQLETIGFSKTAINTTDKHISISDIAISKAAGGMDALVYVSEDGTLRSDMPHGIYNLYVLEGGVTSLVNELARQQAIEHARARDQELPYCAQ